MKTHATIWKDAPELAIPENPALLTYSRELWLAYETTAHPRGQLHAVIQFSDVIDHRLSPINDEGLGQHPYQSAGVKWYAFNELSSSIETRRWAALGARHWVITFKDITLDIVARSATVVADHVRGADPISVLRSFINSLPNMS